MEITIYQKDMKSSITLYIPNFSDARILMQILEKNRVHYIAKHKEK